MRAAAAMNSPELLHLDFVADDTLVGFRLHRLEVFNWGTFGGRVWTLELAGRNYLLTGDIGSGKSTLVDAVTTLLVPSHRVAYNKAAGAGSRERTLRSYVLGHYKSERSEASGSARPVALRGNDSYSVVLGVFKHTGYDHTVTLAQVFWIGDPNSQPERFYAAAERELSIARDFARFGADIGRLRKRLRGEQVETFKSFPPYGAWFRRRFGIDNEQALDLFHQTVSMKSVGNLTEFVRGHMLEPFDVASRIKALIDHFDDLHRAHEAVLKAKRQIDLLTPLVADCERHAQVGAEAQALRQGREALRPWFATVKLALLDERIARLDEDLTRQNAQIGRCEERRDGQRRDVDALRRDIAENGGDRIERLAAEIETLQGETERRKAKARRYRELVRAVDDRPSGDEAGFLEQRRRFAELEEDLVSRETHLQNELMEQEVSFRRQKEQHDELQAEITSLRARQSNIPARQIAMRASLCREVGLAEADLPFAGELLEVRDEERDWEGAAERLLRSFGLSLLVPDARYARVARWVDAIHLSGRLVYFRVRERQGGERSGRAEPRHLHLHSLVRKLSIKPDSAFYEWLEQELARRFDLACCATLDQFRRETRAITRAGQIKDRGERHEKDDRRRIDDRGHYVLGWTNAAKIAALQAQSGQMEARLGELGVLLGKVQGEQREVRERLDTLSKLGEITDYREIDWPVIATEIARLRDEKQRLETASDLLRQLNARLEQANEALAATENELVGRRDRCSKTEERRNNAQALRIRTREVLEGEDLESLRPRFDELAAMQGKALGEQRISVESCDNREQDMRQWLQGRIDVAEQRLSRLNGRIIQAMMAFKGEFKLETSEIDASVEAGPEYREMLERLRADDLPRFEARFKELLNENTIREVANFNSQLNRERESVKDKIARINRSLSEIDYSRGRYIVLEAQAAPDADIRDFQGELRACTEGALSASDDAQYSEARFLQVQRIIERLRGREGSAELDRRWTAKVTDVRNWFVFAASERWREDDSEHEHYSDSGGKSGGQKEKLAYTILAASLAYQFGLQWGAVRSRSFRFVVIDEAFGRGSNESTQYGLELFSKLHLQLLIATPLQKIHIIEPFVAGVGFVHNEDGLASKLRNLSIEEYRKERARLAG